MTNHENHPENENEKFEEEQFYLLVRRFAQLEGQRIIQENEKLKNDQTIVVPRRLDRRCHHLIRQETRRTEHDNQQEFSKENSNVPVKHVYRNVWRVSIAAIICMIVLATAVMANSSIQAGVRYLSLRITDKTATCGSSIYDYDYSTSDSASEEKWAYIEQLPEGYELYDVYSSSSMLILTYRNQDGEEIELDSVSIRGNSAATVTVSIESVDYYEETSIHGYTAILTEKQGLTSITWANEYVGLIISLDATYFTPDELKAMAEEVIFKESVYALTS